MRRETGWRRLNCKCGKVLWWLPSFRHVLVGMIELLSLQHNTPRKHDTLSQFSDNILKWCNNGLCETIVFVFGKRYGLYYFCNYDFVVVPEVFIAYPLMD